MTMIPTPVKANPSWGFPAGQPTNYPSKYPYWWRGFSPTLSPTLSPTITQKHHTIFVRKTTHYSLHIVIHTYPHLYAPIVDLY